MKHQNLFVFACLFGSTVLFGCDPEPIKRTDAGKDSGRVDAGSRLDTGTRDSNVVTDANANNDSSLDARIDSAVDARADATPPCPSNYYYDESSFGGPACASLSGGQLVYCISVMGPMGEPLNCTVQGYSTDGQGTCFGNSRCDDNACTSSQPHECDQIGGNTGPCRPCVY